MAWMAPIGVAIALVAAAAANATAAARVEQANVYAAGSNRLLYRETHWVLPGAAGRWVLYRCADGRPFARKRVASAGATPDFALEDGRDGYGEGVRGDGGTRSVFVRDGGRTRSTPLVVPPAGVIDAGFDAAVRLHWNALLRGEVVHLQFLVPSRKRFYPVRVQRMGEVDWNGLRAERLRMRLDTWFGFAVPDVLLLYGRDDRRLLEFRGTGNVRDAAGDHPQVRIAFASESRTAPAAEVADLRTLPLDGRCRF